MKQLLAAFLLLCAASSSAQAPGPDSTNLYDPKADAQHQIDEAVAKAAKEHKHVFIQIGGNWCIWCRTFNSFVTHDNDLDGYLRANYEVIHINYSEENRNEKVLAKLGFPQRFGFPVFVILDMKGDRIHTQNSAYLEEGHGYNAKKVAEFFRQWAPDALNPANYVDGKR